MRTHDTSTRIAAEAVMAGTARPAATRASLTESLVGDRDALWQGMNRDNATEHTALWTDLTRRAPDEVRTAAACLLAFSSWLGGDGARAWCALDQIPEGPQYSMAALIATVLQEGGHPDLWERAGATGSETETYDPPSPTHRHERDIPRGHEAPGRGAPPR